MDLKFGPKLLTICVLFPLCACAADTNIKKTGVEKKNEKNTTNIEMSTSGNYSPNAYKSSATVRTDSGAEDCLEKLEIRLLKRKKQYDPKKHKECK